MTPTPLSRTAAVLATLTLAACSADPTAPALRGVDASAARPAERCDNVQAEASGALGLWSHGGFGGFGLTPSPITLGDQAGVMASFVHEEYISGSKGQGAHHIVLSHVFWAADGVSWFRTEDRASCAPSDHDGDTCRVNDNLRIVEGAGIYAGAAGDLHNHGWIEFTSYDPPAGTLDLDIHGRVCGDGVS